MDTEPKILVVDDEENLLRSVAKTLFRQGFDVETAGGNAAAYDHDGSDHTVLLACVRHLATSDVKMFKAQEKQGENRIITKQRVCQYGINQ